MSSSLRWVRRATAGVVAILSAGSLSAPSLALADELIAEWQGSGVKATRPFTTPGPWEIQYDAKDVIHWIFAIDENPVPQVIAHNVERAGGSSYVAKGGPWRLEIYATGPWSVRIFSVSP